jgi:Ca-activated chloride channel family protein
VILVFDEIGVDFDFDLQDSVGDLEGRPSFGQVAGKGKDKGGGGVEPDFESLKELRKSSVGSDDGQQNTESYAPIIENEFLSPLKSPLSTFGIDVDTAAYSNVRRFLNQGRLPPRNAVRIEELVNYFHYDEPQPAGDDPFSVSLEAADCPWNPGHRLVRVGLKGKEIDRSQRPHSNLVFLIDVSGSMQDANKLPLVQTALEMLVQQMTENDRIAIVTYAGEAALKLDSTNGHNKQTIRKAIRSLHADGSTNGEAGIKLAYAYEHRIADGANRVILCTDGDFNVGVSDDDQLMQMAHKYANQSGVFLSIFGFGMGNLKDDKLEKLANKGNGHYGYVDNKDEAHKVFVEEMTGTLYTIAKDLKLQLEFNPYQVGAYRLISYENRLLAAEDFDDDRKDAGDVGAGHSLTALFEIIPLDKLRQPVELKYQKVSRLRFDATDAAKKQADPNRELLTLFLRYKQPDGKKSVKREYPLSDTPNDSASDTPSENLQWSAAVAAFGMVIRDSQYWGHANYDLISELALSAKGEDESGRRKEFLELIKKAQTIHKQLARSESSKPKIISQPKPQPKQDSAKPVEIGKNVEYWQTHKTNGNDVAKVIKVLKVLFPNVKTKPGANPGEVMILAQKNHHEKLADLIPRMTLD